MRLKLNLPKMPREYKQFFRSGVLNAIAMGVRKDLTFGTPWMFDHNGENKCLALGWLHRNLVWFRISWGKIPGYAVPGAKLSITAYIRDEGERWLRQRALHNGAVATVGTDVLADFALFGSAME